MITREIFETIEGLNQTYFEKWGCAVDYSATTKNISPENLIIALRRIVETGEVLTLQERIDKNVKYCVINVKHLWILHEIIIESEELQYWISEKWEGTLNKAMVRGKTEQRKNCFKRVMQLRPFCDNNVGGRGLNEDTYR